METAISIAKKLIALFFFPAFVLTSIFLKVAQGPWEKIRHRRKVLYFLLAPFIVVPWAFNFCFFFAWAKLSEE